MFFDWVQKISRLDSQSYFQMFKLFTASAMRTKMSSNMVAPYSSTILRRTFRRISQHWDNTHTLNVENCLLYLSSTILQFLDFIHCMVFDFIFYSSGPPPPSLPGNHGAFAHVVSPRGVALANFIAARGLGISIPRGDTRAFDTLVFERWMSLSLRTRPLSKTGLSVRD